MSRPGKGVRFSNCWDAGSLGAWLGRFDLRSGHLLGTYRPLLVPARADRGGSGAASVGLAHLVGMDTDSDPEYDTAGASRAGLEPVLTLSELAARTGVSVQTL